MPVSDVLTEIRNNSGREDLFTQAGADNGILRYVNAGQKWLDAKMDGHLVTHVSSIVTGAISLELQYLKSVEDVWVANSTSRYQLDPKDLNWLKEEYAKPTSELTTGRPLYFSLAMANTHPSTRLTATTGYYDVDDIILSTGEAYTGLTRNILLFYPPSDGAYTLKVYGEFRNKTISATTDCTWWTENYPLVLALATMLQIENMYRNTQGQNDLLNSIERELDGIDKDVVRKEIVGRNQIRGNAYKYLDNFGRS